jgi:hypothetical protein
MCPREAPRARRLHEELLAQGQREPAHEAHQRGPADQPAHESDEDHAARAPDEPVPGRPQHRDSEEGQQERRQGKHDIRQAREQGVDPAAVDARDNTDQHPHERRHHLAGHAHSEGWTQAKDQRAEQVMPRVVSPQQMDWRGQAILVVGVARGRIDQR